ncbi:UNVERIFIED_CONTAM: hypothetical protein K2H54_032089 [Gekko kuhli]
MCDFTEDQTADVLEERAGTRREKRCRQFRSPSLEVKALFFIVKDGHAGSCSRLISLYGQESHFGVKRGWELHSSPDPRPWDGNEEGSGYKRQIPLLVIVRITTKINRESLPVVVTVAHGCA